jgi:hypothetical protein
MGTRTDNSNDTPELTTELAHRAGDGIEVLLLWEPDDGQLRVVVDDVRTGGSCELVLVDGKQALDAFYHPFAYAAAHDIALSGQRQRGKSVSAEPQRHITSLRRA